MRPLYLPEYATTIRQLSNRRIPDSQPAQTKFKLLTMAPAALFRFSGDVGLYKRDQKWPKDDNQRERQFGGTSFALPTTARQASTDMPAASSPCSEEKAKVSATVPLKHQSSASGAKASSATPKSVFRACVQTPRSSHIAPVYPKPCFTGQDSSPASAGRSSTAAFPKPFPGNLQRSVDSRSIDDSAFPPVPKGNSIFRKSAIQGQGIPGISLSQRPAAANNNNTPNTFAPRQGTKQASHTASPGTVTWASETAPSLSRTQTPINPDQRDASRPTLQGQPVATVRSLSTPEATRSATTTHNISTSPTNHQIKQDTKNAPLQSVRRVPPLVNTQTQNALARQSPIQAVPEPSKAPIAPEKDDAPLQAVRRIATPINIVVQGFSPQKPVVTERSKTTVPAAPRTAIALDLPLFVKLPPPTRELAPPGQEVHVVPLTTQLCPACMDLGKPCPNSMDWIHNYLYQGIYVTWDDYVLAMHWQLMINGPDDAMMDVLYDCMYNNDDEMVWID